MKKSFRFKRDRSYEWWCDQCNAVSNGMACPEHSSCPNAENTRLCHYCYFQESDHEGYDCYTEYLKTLEPQDDPDSDS